MHRPRFFSAKGKPVKKGNKVSGSDGKQLLFREDGGGWWVGRVVLVAHEAAQSGVVLLAAGGVVHCGRLLSLAVVFPFVGFLSAS